MKLFQTSGPALFMYTVIACCLIASLVCFYVYYNAIFVNEIILWIGITAFTILYHFWGRIILGNVSKIFRRFISYKSWWFKERSFEKDLYEKLKVKKWKKLFWIVGQIWKNSTSITFIIPLDKLLFIKYSCIKYTTKRGANGRTIHKPRRAGIF